MNQTNYFTAHRISNISCFIYM